MSYPLISVQILNWNRAEETQRSIQSALNQSYPNLEVVLVDNGSTDNSVELSRINFPSIKIVQLDKNHGCPGGRNLGVSSCSGEFIFYLDNDGVLHKDAVLNAYRSMSTSESIGIVTGVVYDFVDESEIDLSFAISNSERYYFKNFQGGICMHRKSMYAHTGLYPSHFIYGAEEFYLTLKAFESDYLIVKDESVVLWHKRSSVARDRKKELANAYFNKLYTSVSLFPFSDAFKFSLYFIFGYSKYAYQEGIFNYFIVTLPRKYVRAIKTGIQHRNPVSSSAFAKYKRFKKIPI